MQCIQARPLNVDHSEPQPVKHTLGQQNLAKHHILCKFASTEKLDWHNTVLLLLSAHGFPVFTSCGTVHAAAKAAAEAALRAAQGADPAGAAAGAGPSNTAAAASNGAGPSNTAAVASNGAGPSNAAAAAPLNVAGPTGGTAQPVGGATEGQQHTMLTFFGRADDCAAAKQTVEQEMQVSTDKCM